MGFLVLEHLLDVAGLFGQGGFVKSLFLCIRDLLPEGTEFLANLGEGKKRLFLFQFVAGFRAEQHVACKWSFGLVIIAFTCSLLFFLLFVLSILSVFVVFSMLATAWHFVLFLLLGEKERGVVAVFFLFSFL